MFIIRNDSIKPIKKWLIEDNQYVIIIEYIEEDEFKGKLLRHVKTQQRFCKAKKNGDIIINFNGQKIKENINNIVD